MSLDGQLTATHQVQWAAAIGDIAALLVASTVERDDGAGRPCHGADRSADHRSRSSWAMARSGWSWPKGRSRDLEAVGGRGPTPQPVVGRAAFLTLTVDQPRGQAARGTRRPCPMRLVPVALFEATTFRRLGRRCRRFGARLFAARRPDRRRQRPGARAPTPSPPPAPIRRSAPRARCGWCRTTCAISSMAWSGGNYRPQTPAETWERALWRLQGQDAAAARHARPAGDHGRSGLREHGRDGRGHQPPALLRSVQPRDRARRPARRGRDHPRRLAGRHAHGRSPGGPRHRPALPRRAAGPRERRRADPHRLHAARPAGGGGGAGRRQPGGHRAARALHADADPAGPDRRADKGGALRDDGQPDARADRRGRHRLRAERQHRGARLDGG